MAGTRLSTCQSSKSKSDRADDPRYPAINLIVLQLSPVKHQLQLHRYYQGFCPSRQLCLTHQQKQAITPRIMASLDVSTTGRQPLALHGVTSFKSVDPITALRLS